MEYYNYSNNSNNGGLNIISLLLLVLMIVALWRIFVKAGEKGWKSIIPVYSAYILCKICNARKVGKVYVGIFIGMIVMLFFMTTSIIMNTASTMVTGSSLSYESVIGSLGFMSMFFILLYIAIIAFYIFIGIKLAKVFGKEGGFAVGLILLPIVFFPILAFGKAEYVGINENTNSNTTTANTDNNPNQQQ